MSSKPLRAFTRSISTTAAPLQVHVDVVKIADLDATTYQQLRSLTMRDFGLMQDDLARARRGAKMNSEAASLGYAAIAFTREDGIVGWALLTNVGALHTLCESGTMPRPRRSWLAWHAHVYVKVKYRRRGIGSQLYSRLRMIAPRFQVFKHTHQSRSFYDATEERVSPTARCD